MEKSKIIQEIIGADDLKIEIVSGPFPYVFTYPTPKVNPELVEKLFIVLQKEESVWYDCEECKCGEKLDGCK